MEFGLIESIIVGVVMHLFVYFYMIVVSFGILESL